MKTDFEKAIDNMDREIETMKQLIEANAIIIKENEIIIKENDAFIKKLKTLVIVCFVCYFSYAQNNVKYISFNVITQGVIGGIGSAINKKQNQSYVNAAWKGFYKGCLGGSLNSVALNVVKFSSDRNTLAYIMPARLINSLGSSITQNASTNDNYFHSLDIDLLFVNIRIFDFKDIVTKIDVMSLSYFGVQLFDKSKTFDLKSTIVTGSLIFKNNNMRTKTLGVSIANALYSTPKFTSINGKHLNTYNGVICHEFIHYCQYNSMYSLSTFYTKNLKYIKINTAFMFLYVLNNTQYSNNIFEKEASFYGL